MDTNSSFFSRSLFPRVIADTSYLIACPLMCYISRSCPYFQVAIIFTCSRLAYNTVYTYLALFLTERLQFAKVNSVRYFYFVWYVVKHGIDWLKVILRKKIKTKQNKIRVERLAQAIITIARPTSFGKIFTHSYCISSFLIGLEIPVYSDRVTACKS